MIVCGIQSKTVNGHKVHEIALKCHGCESQFVLSAVHECDDEEEEYRESDGITNSYPNDETYDSERKGIEWLQDGGTDLINIVI